MKSYRQMADTDFDRMTVRELKNYIRDMSKRVVSQMKSTNARIAKHARDLVNEIGTYRRNRKTYLKLGFGKARKADLISRAEQLRGFSNTYVDTNFKLDEQHRKAMETFKNLKQFKSKFKNITEREYDDMVKIMDSVEDILEDFGSEVAELYHDYIYRKHKSPKILADLIREAYDELSGTGADTEDVLDLVKKKLLNS